MNILEKIDSKYSCWKSLFGRKPKYLILSQRSLDLLEKETESPTYAKVKEVTFYRGLCVCVIKGIEKEYIDIK